MTWTRNFSLIELENSCNFFWDDESDSEAILLFGIFYLTLVSPSFLEYNGLIDTGNYITKQLESHELTIRFIKSTQLIQNGQVNLWGAYMISLSYNRQIDFNQFEMTILTYVPNFLQNIEQKNQNKKNS